MFGWSTDQMSAEHTSRLLEPFLRWLSPGISAEAVANCHLLIRKAAHVTEYAILALLLARLFRAQLPLATRRSVLALTLGAAVAFAIADEFHQSFVPSRTSSPFDVVIDTIGAATACCLMHLGFGRQKPKR